MTNQKGEEGRGGEGVEKGAEKGEIREKGASKGCGQRGKRRKRPLSQVLRKTRPKPLSIDLSALGTTNRFTFPSPGPGCALGLRARQGASSVASCRWRQPWQRQFAWQNAWLAHHAMPQPLHHQAVKPARAPTIGAELLPEASMAAVDERCKPLPRGVGMAEQPRPCDLQVGVPGSDELKSTARALTLLAEEGRDVARAIVVAAAGAIGVALDHRSPLVAPEVGKRQRGLAEAAKGARVGLKEERERRKVRVAACNIEQVAAAFVASIRRPPLVETAALRGG